VKSGKLVALAVTSPKRFALLPQIPSLSESGLPGFDMSTWWGLVFPARVNKEIAARLHDSTVRILQQPDVRESMAKVGAEIVGNTPDEFAAFIRSERVKYAKVIKDANIKLE